MGREEEEDEEAEEEDEEEERCSLSFRRSAVTLLLPFSCGAGDGEAVDSEVRGDV